MPNIREGAAPAGLGLNPTETGVDARAGAGRRVGAFYNAAGEALNDTGRRAASTVTDVGEAVVSHVDLRDRENVSAAATGILAKADQQWNLITKGNGLDPKDPNYIAPADPRDTTVAQKFMDEQVQPALDKLNDISLGAAGQRLAQEKIDQYRQHLSQKFTADMMSRAGDAAILQDRVITNNLSNVVTTSPDFHSVDFALQQHKDAVAGLRSNPNISGEQAGKLDAHSQLSREQIVHAAETAAISKSPDPVATAAAFSKRYPDYVKGDVANTMAKAAEAQAKVNTLHDKQTAVAQRQLDDLTVHKGATDVMTKNVSIDPLSGSPIINPKFFNDALQILKNNPDAPSAAATARTLIDWGESQLNKEKKVVDDPTVRADLMARMFSTDKPTTTIDLMKARADGKISDHTFQTYHGLVQELEQTPLKGPVWHDTNEAVKSELVLNNVGLPGKDITGEGNYAKWAQTFIPLYLAKSRAGTLEPNALDVKDPNSLISKSMEPFKRSVQQRAQDYLSVLVGGDSPTAPARKIGDVPVPPALGGIAALQYSPATKQWRDQTSGTVYDATGKPMAR